MGPVGDNTATVIFPSPTETFPFSPKGITMGQAEDDDDVDSAAIGIDSGIIEEPTVASDPRKHRRSVSFSSVQVREYDLCLGDNPSVGTGAPVSLDWSYHNEESYP